MHSKLILSLTIQALQEEWTVLPQDYAKSEMHGICPLSRHEEDINFMPGQWTNSMHTYYWKVMIVTFISSCDIDVSAKIVKLILLHSATFDSVTKLLVISILCYNNNQLLLGMWLVRGIAAYLYTKIIYFSMVGIFVRPLTEVALGGKFLLLSSLFSYIKGQLTLNTSVEGMPSSPLLTTSSSVKQQSKQCIKWESRALDKINVHTLHGSSTRRKGHVGVFAPEWKFY